MGEANLDLGDKQVVESEQRVFERIAEFVPVFLYVYDLFEQRFVFINQRIKHVLGYRPEELTAMSVEELKSLVHPDDLPVFYKLLQQLETASREDVFESEFRIRHANGNYCWLLFCSSVFAQAPEGNFLEVIGAARDVSKEKRTELALRESEENLSLLVESAKDYVIITMDAGGRINMWNPGAERAFGYSQEEILGESCEILFTPEDRAKGIPAKEMKTARAKGSAADERWHVRKDGTRFYASGVLTLLRNSEIEGFAKIAHDLTEHKRAAEQLQKDNDWLEGRVAERTDELKQANNALESEISERRTAEQRIRRLLREIVHIQEGERRRIARDLHDQMGQQLNVLAINLDILKKECEEYNMPCERVEAIQSIVEQLDSDVDFLTWELRPTVLDDLGLLAALEKYAREWTKHFGIQVEVFSPGIEKARFPMEVETMLYRIAQEALNNVSKHAHAKQVRLLLERRKNEIWLTIDDDGEGFEVRKQAFSGGDGKGLGLIGMQERAALVDGSVEIESQPGNGTTILVRVPLPQQI
jgi:PAS domain S-box-containing protein